MFGVENNGREVFKSCASTKPEELTQLMDKFKPVAEEAIQKIAAVEVNSSKQKSQFFVSSKELICGGILNYSKLTHEFTNLSLSSVSWSAEEKIGIITDYVKKAMGWHGSVILTSGTFSSSSSLSSLVDYFLSKIPSKENKEIFNLNRFNKLYKKIGPNTETVEQSYKKASQKTETIEPPPSSRIEKNPVFLAYTEEARKWGDESTAIDRGIALLKQSSLSSEDRSKELKELERRVEQNFKNAIATSKTAHTLIDEMTASLKK